LIVLLGVLALSACNLPQGGTQSPTQDPNLIYTAAAQTVQAQLTQNAIGTPIAVPSQTPVPAQPTNTVVVPPTSAPLPTSTSQPLPTSTTAPPATAFVPCDRASFYR
jgi:hypothetical protein